MKKITILLILTVLILGCNTQKQNNENIKKQDLTLDEHKKEIVKKIAKIRRVNFQIDEELYSYQITDNKVGVDYLLRQIFDNTNLILQFEPVQDVFYIPLRGVDINNKVYNINEMLKKNQYNYRKVNQYNTGNLFINGLSIYKIIWDNNYFNSFCIGINNSYNLYELNSIRDDKLINRFNRMLNDNINPSIKISPQIIYRLSSLIIDVDNFYGFYLKKSDNSIDENCYNYTDSLNNIIINKVVKKINDGYIFTAFIDAGEGGSSINVIRIRFNNKGQITDYKLLEP